MALVPYDLTAKLSRHRPEKLEDLVDFVVARILDQLGIEQEIMPPWGQ